MDSMILYILNKQLNKLEINKFDILVGSRFIEGSKIKGLTKRRERSSSIANYLARLNLYGFYSHLTDYMSGFILFKRNSCIKFIEKIDVNGFKFFYDLLALSKGKLKVIEIPLVFKERIYGNSKLDLPVVWDFLISLIHSFIRRIIPRRAVSFALVGSSGVVVKLLTIYFFVSVKSFDFEQVLPVGVVIAETSNFTINNFFTFRTNKLSGKKFYLGLMKFLLVSPLPIIANIGITTLFYSQLSINSFISQIGGILVVFI